MTKQMMQACSCNIEMSTPGFTLVLTFHPWYIIFQYLTYKPASPVYFCNCQFVRVINVFQVVLDHTAAERPIILSGYYVEVLNCFFLCCMVYVRH